MKKKLIKLTEQELYYAAKNKRRQWWKDNGEKFFIYPSMVACFGLLAFFLLLGLTSIQLQLLKTNLFRKERYETKDMIRKEIESHPSREVIHIHEYIHQEAPKPQLIYTNWNLSTNFMGTNFTTNFLITNINWFPKTYYYNNGTWK